MDLLVLSGSQVDEVAQKFTPDELMTLMARVFADLSSSKHSTGSADDGQRVTIPHRSTIVGANHRTLFMPSRIPSFGTAIKIVSVPSAHAPLDVKERGLPGSTAVLDDRTGEVIALVNARKLTALRNAASSLLATRLMLPDAAQPQTLVAIGAGAQISAHLHIFLSFYPSIRVCKIFNRSHNQRLTELVKSLNHSFPELTIEGYSLEDDAGAESPELKPAIGAAQIVITATSSTLPLFPSSYVSPGAHLCLIGSYTPAMREIDSALVGRASKIVVDYVEGAVVEAGELIEAGVGRESLLELGELLDFTGHSTYSTNAKKVQEASTGDVTIFKSVGVGVQDVAIARAVMDSARRHAIGSVIHGYH